MIVAGIVLIVAGALMLLVGGIFDDSSVAITGTIQALAGASILLGALGSAP